MGHAEVCAAHLEPEVPLLDCWWHVYVPGDLWTQYPLKGLCVFWSLPRRSAVHPLELKRVEKGV